MKLTINQIEGPAALSEPFVIEDNEDFEVSFGRSRSNDVEIPAECETVGGEDIVLEKTGTKSVQVRRRGVYNLEVNGVPALRDQNNILLHSGDMVRLGNPDGPLFQIKIEAPEKTGFLKTLRTETFVIADSIGAQLTKQRRALQIACVVFGVAILGIAGYQIYVPLKLELNRERLVNSTYLVAKEGPGIDKSWATAFVIGDNVLATNAHVTEAIRATPKMFYLLDPDGRRLDIVSVKTHPAYTAFEHKKWSLGEKVSGKFKHLPLQAAYDVGLIRVHPKEDLSDSRLHIASAEELVGLEPGTKLMAAGFPSEGLVGADHATLGRPRADSLPGEIRALQDIFQIGDERNEHRVLVEHSFPVAGGVSGSPVVDEGTGKVVAVISGGNVVLDRDGIRIANPAMVNFAHRADLLGELIDGTAEKRLPLLEAYWAEVGKRFDQYKDYLHERFLDRARGKYGLEDANGVLLEDGTLRPPQAKGKPSAQTIIVEAKPDYIYGLVVHLTGDPESFSRTDLTVWKGGSLLMAGQNGALENDVAVVWRNDVLPAAWVRVSEPGELEVKLGGFLDGPVDYELELYTWPLPAAMVAEEPASVTQDQEVPVEAPAQ